jgi:4-diphosphocytidyl-2-C-methyl-D-erythritol kinase
VLLPAAGALSTAEVFRQADRMGLARPSAELADRRRTVSAAGAHLPGELIVNDLEPAARALCPSIDDALRALRAAGAEHALVCGSGATVAGLFPRVDAARGAALALAERTPRPIVVEPWRGRVAQVAGVSERSER